VAAGRENVATRGEKESFFIGSFYLSGCRRFSHSVLTRLIYDAQKGSTRVDPIAAGATPRNHMTDLNEIYNTRILELAGAIDSFNPDKSWTPVLEK